MWETVALGGVVGILVSVAFVGGCFCGSWVQRSIGYIIRTRLDKELLDSAKEREEKSYDRRRMQDFQARRTQNIDEAMANIARKPEQSPLGGKIPSPEEIDELLGHSSPTDFTKNLGTERMKAAREARGG